MFESKKLYQVIDSHMSAKDNEDFWCDCRQINMSDTYNDVFYAVQRYYMKIDLPKLDSGFK